MMTVDTLPEELLERILRYSLVDNKHPLSVLLTSAKFHRIALPAYYRDVHLRTDDACRKFAALDPTQIRPYTLTIANSALYCPLLPSVLATYHNAIQELDITMEMPPSKSSWDDLNHIEQLCHALASLDSLKHFSLRKGSGAPFLLGAHWTRQFLGTLAQSIEGRWNYLDSVHIAFKMAQMDVFVSLLEALGTLANLRTLATEMPTIWNNLLLDFAQTKKNNADIMLLVPGSKFSHSTPPQSTSPQQAAEAGALYPSLYMALSSVYMHYAKQHEGLMESLQFVTPSRMLPQPKATLNSPANYLGPMVMAPPV